MFDLLGLSASIFIFLITIEVWRQSSGLFSLPFLTMVYICFLYLGALHFYWTQGHFTFLFVLLMGFFYLLGVILANITRKSRKQAKHGSLYLYSPLNTQLLALALTTAVVLFLCISIYRILSFGAPLLSKSWYTVGLMSTTGLINRLLYSLGIAGFLIVALLSYGIYKATSRKFFKYMTTFSFTFYVGFQILQGGKAAAVMPFLILLMTLFYTNKKVPLKVVLLITGFALMFSLVISVFWVGNLSFSQMFRLYFYRATVDAALHLDYLLNEWAPNNHYLLGGTIWLEIKRIITQITSTSKEPLFKEIIDNLRAGRSEWIVTGMSPELSVFGNLGYANFGILGAIFVAITLGFFIQRIDILLRTRRYMNVFSFTLWICFAAFWLRFVRAGDIIIGLEKYIIEVIPPLFTIILCYWFFALPYPQALHWKKLRVICM